MDEIELLRGFRAELPGPRPERREAALAALTGRIESASRPNWPRQALSWRSRKLKLGAAAAAGVALAIGVPILLLGGGTEVEPAAAKVLREVALVAASQRPEPQPAPGQYVFTRSREAYMTTVVGLSPVANGPGGDGHEPAGAWSVLVPRERELWIALNGSGRLRELTGRPRFLSAAQRATWVAAGSPALPQAGQVSDERFAAHQLHYFRSAALPTDPKRLRKLIEARQIPGINGPPGEAETFELLGEMLRETDLLPALRAAIYEVAAELPRIELLGDVRDPVGRQGVGVAFTDHRRGTRHELIFDPSDSALLGERDIVVAPGGGGLQVPAGTTVGYASYLESKVVDSTAAPSHHGVPTATESRKKAGR